MTEDEWVAGYARSAGMSPAALRARMVANRNAVPTPCHCGEDFCQGWAWEEKWPPGMDWLERRKERT